MENWKTCFRNLWAFCQVVREGSFSRAAEVEGKTQPAISTAIRNLEEHLKVKLLERSGKKLQLTEAGKKVYERASKMFEEVRNTLNEIESLCLSTPPLVRIVATSLVTHEFLNEAIESFQQLNPHYRLQLFELPTVSAIRTIMHDEVDIGIVGETQFPDSLIIRYLTSIEFFAIIPNGFELSQQEELYLENIKNMPLILPHKTSSVREILNKFLLFNHVKPIIKFEATSHHAIKRLIIDGVGIGFLPRGYVKEELREGKVVAKRIAGISPIMKKVFLIYKKKQLPHAAQIFKNFITKWIKEHHDILK